MRDVGLLAFRWVTLRTLERGNAGIRMETALQRGTYIARSTVNVRRKNFL